VRAGGATAGVTTPIGEIEVGERVLTYGSVFSADSDTETDPKPCPEIKPGPGRVVMMTSVTAYEGWMATVTFTNAWGHSEAITGTSGHSIFSLDRCGYVDLESLKLGERVRTADGWATGIHEWGRARGPHDGKLPDASRSDHRAGGRTRLA